MTKSTTKIEPGSSLLFKKTPPKDFYWALPKKKFIGEIYDTVNDRPYHRNCGRGYRPPLLEMGERHNNEGHFQGYSFGIEHFSPVGGLVCDPFVGSGTTLIESYLKGRNSVGNELEFTKVLDNNIQYIKSKFPGGPGIKTSFGDSSEWVKKLKKDSFDLVISGPPYPVLGASVSSDAPERFLQNKPEEDGPQKLYNYEAEDSIGLLKWGKGYMEGLLSVYNPLISKIKSGGSFITIIKDLMHKGAPFLLHKYIMDAILEANPDLYFEGWYIHQHYPPTMFMSTYPKKFPGIQVPIHQVAIVLKKK